MTEIEMDLFPNTQELEMNLEKSSGGSGTTNYNELSNKPKINNVTLRGELSLEDLGIKNYDEEIEDLETNKADKTEIPTKTSDLSNDSGYITNVVNDLVNYYKKTETYTKTEVNDLISAVSTMDVRVVQVLPTEDISTTTIYLVPKQTPATQDVYDEYIYVSNAWEHIGSTDIDLSDYITTSDLNTALSNYTTTSQLTTLLNAKQNTIDSTHKLASDLVDDTNQTNKFVTTNEKTTWNSKVGSSYINNIWYGTEAEYNAIVEKDSNTLYLLEE
jgi:hypothetical protein